jgi:NAD(P)-dependent dehydrogenase (short-subunit alcohol dehydrogenase family)
MGVLDGKVAIITGAGRGIGASIARAYAAEGADLVLNDLGATPDGRGNDQGPAHEIAEELIANGARAVADAGDVADMATGERLVHTAVDQFGKLDIVVNVAGILRDRMIFNMSEEDWDEVIRVHLKGHFSTIRPASAYWRQLRDREGHFRIINFTSGSGLGGSPGQANYAAAKMGIVGLTYSLAQGLARYGVTANAISPSAATRLTATVPDTRRNPIQRGNEDRPERSPDNIAPVCVFLAADESDWLTGRVIASSGYEVRLYANPEVIRQLNSPVPWTYETLAPVLTQSFRPVADGLPPSFFSSQLENL